MKKMKTKSKNKLYNIILTILSILFILVVILIILKYGGIQKNKKELKISASNIIKELEKENKENKDNNEKKEQIKIKHKGYNVVGIIKIPSINIEYPILENTNDETMKISITKFWGNNVNDIGNFTMAGHNYYKAMFGDIKKLNIEDIIEMTDLTGNTVKYKIFDKYITDPNDVKCIEGVEKDKREITLITCTKGRSNRLIIKAREKIL